MRFIGSFRNFLRLCVCKLRVLWYPCMFVDYKSLFFVDVTRKAQFSSSNRLAAHVAAHVVFFFRTRIQKQTANFVK